MPHRVLKTSVRWSMCSLSKSGTVLNGKPKLKRMGNRKASNVTAVQSTSVDVENRCVRAGEIVVVFHRKTSGGKRDREREEKKKRGEKQSREGSCVVVNTQSGRTPP